MKCLSEDQKEQLRASGFTDLSSFEDHFFLVIWEEPHENSRFPSVADTKEEAIALVNTSTNLNVFNGLIGWRVWGMYCKGEEMTWDYDDKKQEVTLNFPKDAAS